MCRRDKLYPPLALNYHLVLIIGRPPTSVYSMHLFFGGGDYKFFFIGGIPPQKNFNPAPTATKLCALSRFWAGTVNYK